MGFCYFQNSVPCFSALLITQGLGGKYGLQTKTTLLLSHHYCETCGQLAGTHLPPQRQLQFGDACNVHAVPCHPFKESLGWFCLKTEATPWALESFGLKGLCAACIHPEEAIFCQTPSLQHGQPAKPLDCYSTR